jgi:hypothetical protein
LEVYVPGYGESIFLPEERVEDSAATVPEAARDSAESAWAVMEFLAFARFS